MPPAQRAARGLRPRTLSGKSGRFGSGVSAVRSSALILLALTVLGSPRTAWAEAIGPHRLQAQARNPIRGMTVSCPVYGQIWGRPAFTRALRTLRSLGVRWVALHPYARIRSNGVVESTPAAQTGYLQSAVERARRESILLFWKPHLAYWGSFEWRGSIDFRDDRAAWERFFRTYRTFILDQARFAARADIPLFAVGVELERMVGFEARWRSLIEEVRDVYPGELTWAANWDGISRVGFWDALDYIGVQGYFPLSSTQSPAREMKESDIRRAWSTHVAKLEELSERVGRPILFTEIGYPNADHAARTPWKPDGVFQRSDPELRGRLVRVALRHLEPLPFVAGMFWWKWIPARRSWRGDFAMQTDQMRALLTEFWGRPEVLIPSQHKR